MKTFLMLLTVTLLLAGCVATVEPYHAVYHPVYHPVWHPYHYNNYY